MLGKILCALGSHKEPDKEIKYSMAYGGIFKCQRCKSPVFIDPRQAYNHNRLIERKPKDPLQNTELKPGKINFINEETMFERAFGRHFGSEMHKEVGKAFLGMSKKAATQPKQAIALYLETKGTSDEMELKTAITKTKNDDIVNVLRLSHLNDMPIKYVAREVLTMVKSLEIKTKGK